MYLKRLEIFGFKSFADKTILNFEQGITAVIGPNGCGKSNVFDSIRWVLGEQSSKELRGSSMEDVIFNGTDKRPSLGFAEVSLTFSNTSKALPIEYDEVTITRRLFRSGESEYLINKNTVRLRDVVELFLGTGIGAEAYSLIQQGKVDLVVSAKPDERRQIFDEAAGITKYKSKKREALGKLKETEDNLLRINDIVVEVKRQIATIERQAKKAQRYKEEFEQLKNLEVALAAFSLKLYTDQRAQFAAASQQMQEKETNGLRQLEEYNNLIAHETNLLEEVEDRINELKSQEMRLANDIELNGRQIGFNEERLQTIETDLIRLEQQEKMLTERVSGHQQKIVELKSALAGFEEVLNEAKGRLYQKQDALTTIAFGIEEAQGAIQLVEQEIVSGNAQQARIKNQLTDNMKQVMECLARKTRLDVETNKVVSEKQEVSQKYEAINQEILKATGRLEQLKLEHQQKKQLGDESRAQLTNQQQVIDDLEKKKLFLISQKEFITKMHVQYQDNPDPVVEGRFVSTVAPQEKQTGLIGKIKNIATGVNAENQPVYEITCETKFIELNPADMDERIAAIDQNITTALGLKEQLDQMVQERVAAIEESLRNIGQEEKWLSVFEAQKNDIEAVSGKLTGELDVIGSESTEVEQTLAQLKLKEQELDRQLHAVSEDITAKEQAIKEKRQWLALKDQERQQVNLAIVQLEAEQQSLVDKCKSQQENLALFVHSLSADQAELAGAKQGQEQSRAKQASIQEDIVTLTAAVEELRVKKESLTGIFRDCESQRAEMNQRLHGVRNNTRALEEQIIQVKTERHSQELKLQELNFSERSIKERLLQAYKIDFDALPVTGPSEGENVPSLEDNTEQLNAEIDRLKKRCESYGAVNLVAIEEFEELKNRFEFLTKQQSDLLTARDSLMQTIQKINRTTRQMFTDSFTKVCEEFRVYFRMLFGGGEAQLVLLDPQNALESGIDIIARPPGKKLQNISLLSGGEKTMTAIALIFAVFKVNPSPFCVLDEIDAALDEANVGRFALLLKDFAKVAQFIVVTHNKKTMENADIMYGITMQETGVSRIVSVKFSDKDQHQQKDAMAAETTAEPQAVGV